MHPSVSEKWDTRFSQLAAHIAAWSTDTTQVGAVLVCSRTQTLLSTGYNGYARGIEPTQEMRTRPEKYLWVIHAEHNALLNAARLGQTTEGATLYATLPPCTHCAAALIQAGIQRLVCPPPFDTSHTDWRGRTQDAQDMLRSAGISLDLR